jgi:hypothetical protein
VGVPLPPLCYAGVMDSHPDTNSRLVSTRIGWIPATITEAPQGTGRGRRRRPSKPFLAKREWRRPLTITVSYRGTSEALILVTARGRSRMVDGHLSLLDVLVDIWDGDERAPDND